MAWWIFSVARALVPDGITSALIAMDPFLFSTRSTMDGSETHVDLELLPLGLVFTSAPSACKESARAFHLAGARQLSGEECGGDHYQNIESNLNVSSKKYSPASLQPIRMCVVIEGTNAHAG